MELVCIHGAAWSLKRFVRANMPGPGIEGGDRGPRREVGLTKWGSITSSLQLLAMLGDIYSHYQLSACFCTASLSAARRRPVWRSAVQRGPCHLVVPSRWSTRGHIPLQGFIGQLQSPDFAPPTGGTPTHGHYIATHSAHTRCIPFLLVWLSRCMHRVC